MSALSNALGNYGSKHTIEHEGVVYELSFIDQKMKTHLEQALYTRAFEAEYATKPAYTEEAFEGRLEKLRDAYEAGEFAFESPRALAFLSGQAGLVKLASLILGIDDIAVLGSLINAKKDEVMEKVKLVLRQSLRTKPKTAPTGGEVPGEAN